jgi:hypothetical protein
MRKATLLIAVLLCFGLATAFAGPVQVEPEYEAEASATWGIQLDDQASGFANSAESTIMFTFIEEQTAEYGEGTTYGYIMVEDFEVEFEAEGEDADVAVSDAFTISPGEITGKVFFGPAYLVVFDGADDEVDEIDAEGKILDDVISPTTTVGVDPNVALDPETEYGGVALGFEVPDLVTVELGVASESDWRTEGESVTWGDLGYTQDELDAFGAGADVDDEIFATDTGYNEQNAYVWSVNAEVTPVEMVTVNLVSNMWHGNRSRDDAGEYINPTPGTPNNPASVGLSAEYSMPLTDDINLVPTVGFDLVTEQDVQEDQNMRMEFGASVGMLWPGLGLDEDDDDHIDFLPGDEEVTSGVTLGAVYGIHPVDQIQGALAAAGVTAPATGDIDETLNTMSLKLGFFEDGGDDGFLPIVGAAAMVNYNMVFENEDASVPEAKNDLGLGLELNADLGVVSPYAGMIYEVYDLPGNYDADTDPGDEYLGLFTYDNDAEAGLNNKNNFTLNVGTDINVIPNTTFTLDYASGNLLFDEDVDAGAWAAAGDTYTPLQDSDATNSTSAMAGVFTIETSIEF